MEGGANIQYLLTLAKMAAEYSTIVIGSERKASAFRHLLDQTESFRYRGFYDPDDPSNADVFGSLLFTLELADRGDVFLFDRHISHVDTGLIEHLVRMGKHILFDGFLIRSANAASSVLRLQQESGNCIHIANVLHNKPLFTTAAQFVRKPRFIRIEKHCSAPRPGEFDTWFYQNLSQELDICIRLADSGIRNLTARPLFLFGSSPDLLNIHIEFDNDAVCHISAGRAIENGVHKFRVFQQDRLFHLDFSENLLTELRLSDKNDQLTILPADDLSQYHEFIEIPRSVMPFDAWKMELRNFAENIQKHLTPITNLEHLEHLNHTTEWILDRVLRKYAGV